MVMMMVMEEVCYFALAVLVCSGACPRVLAYNDDFSTLRVFRGEGASPLICVERKVRKVCCGVEYNSKQIRTICYYYRLSPSNIQLAARCSSSYA